MATRPLAVTLSVPERAPADPVFFYDLGSPGCYLAAERVLSVLPVVPEWEPVLAAELGAAAEELDRVAIESRARELGIQTLRWPARWPLDSREATLAATYAKQIGRAVSFSLACFRQIFAAGRDPGDRDTVLLAGAASEMHPSALIKALGLRSVTAALEAAQARARTAGVSVLPAIAAAGQVFAGEGAVEQAALVLGGGR